MYKMNKKCSNNVEKLCQQIRQGPYFICGVCHRGSYKGSARLFELVKYNILPVELYCPVKSFDKKSYICDTCDKYLSSNEMPCQAVFNKMILSQMS